MPKQARADRSDVSAQRKHGRADEVRHSRVSSVQAKERRDSLPGEGRHGGSLRGESQRGGSLNSGSLHGGSAQGGSLHGGSLHGGHVSASAKAKSKAGSSGGVQARVKVRFLPLKEGI